MRQPHPPGVGGGARREDDLGQVVGRAAVPARIVRLAAAAPSSRRAARSWRSGQRCDVAVPARRDLQALADEQHGARVDNRPRRARRAPRRRGSPPARARPARAGSPTSRRSSPGSSRPRSTTLLARPDVRRRARRREKASDGAAHLVVRVACTRGSRRRGRRSPPRTGYGRRKNRVSVSRLMRALWSKRAGRPLCSPGYLNEAPTLSTMSVMRGDLRVLGSGRRQRD